MAESEHQSACSEDNSSVCDEERARKLFQACDGDGDGFIDSHDLLYICRELNLESSVEELMKELGADSDGRISYNAFSRCRLALRSEIEALRSATPRESYLPTSSDNSLGGKPDTWEFDSGARDLSPEPHTLQRLVEAAAGVNALSTTSTANLLQLANKLHLAALASLRGEILDLSTRLQTVTEERDLLEKTLADTQASIEASSVQHYEERITELHSVIAELTRKIERQRTLVIAEEEDHEQSETEVISVGSCHEFADEKEKNESNLEGSGDDEEEEGVEEEDDEGEEEEEGELVATTTCAGDSPSSSWVHQKNCEELHSPTIDLAKSLELNEVDLKRLATSSSKNAAAASSKNAAACSKSAAVDSKQVTAHLAATVSELETRNADLQQIVSSKEEEIRRLQRLLCVAEGGEQLRSKKRSRERPSSKARESRRTRSARDHALTTSLAGGVTSFGQLPPGGSPSPPVPKVAERVRLRRMDPHVTGSDIASFGVSHTEVAEHLVSGLQEQCDLLEMGTDLRKFEIETEKLTSRLEHTRALNTLLQITLEETKSHCERLTQLVGKYETNVVALQLALGCCDRMLDAYEELLQSLSKESNQKTEKERDELRSLIEGVRRERATIEGTVVKLESYYEEQPPPPLLLSCSPARARKLDLETAVLMQEVMSMREEKADLNASVYQLEKEKEALQVRLAAVFDSQQVQSAGQATVQQLRTLKEAAAAEKKFGDRDSRSPHARSRSKHSAERSADRALHHNSDLRQRGHVEQELQASNSMLAYNQERSKPKLEPKPQRLEAHVLDRVGRHSQVQAFRQRLAHMLDSSRNSSSHGSS
ncbi:hypothetical protein LSTR_LSTR011344 [Laodelphax striatellus]|uniref:EF-hand domain-containing protein n=1 Tax=Laodelphax striatellus TaxID=195883 RepID=A0A482XSR3_LAOST|nr:hypothetical protein LSTR_LSTR011344 [Laodelphax striatellus]